MTPTEVFDPETELASLVDVLPPALQGPVKTVPAAELLEIILDLGRVPEARLIGRTERLSEVPVSTPDIDYVLGRVGEVGQDNRAGIERTLHRVSAIRNRRGRVVGLTLRVGRAVFGTIEMVKDLVESGLSLLLLGRPGVGKTTKLREIARVLADDLGKRVMVIDTSNEIGGDGDIPHPAIGTARRMQVARPELQHAVMIEAVENHMPEAIIVDEIGTSAEALAARTIAERGVQLVATAHGNTLENLVLNPTLSDLVGGVHTVTLSDEEARRRGTLKTVNERRSMPTFDAVVEMASRDEVVVHRDTAAAVDALLAGKPLGGERRTQLEDRVEVKAEGPKPSLAGAQLSRGATRQARAPGQAGPVKVNFYGIGRKVVDRVMRNASGDLRVVTRPDSADAIFALRARASDPRIRKFVEKGDRQVHLLKRATAPELRRAMRTLLGSDQKEAEEETEAREEAERAIERALSERVPIHLTPRPARLRKLQHVLAEEAELQTMSIGTGDERHLIVFPEDVSPEE